MAQNIEPLMTIKQGGVSYVLYANRIEWIKPAAFGKTNTTTILLRNIASCDFAGVLKRIRIKTNDGKAVELPIGGSGDDARKFYDLIMANL